MLNVSGMSGFGARSQSGPPAALTFIASPASQTATTSVKTFSGASIGTTDSTRVVIFCVMSEGSAGNTIDSGKIGGSAATLIKTVAGGAGNAAIFARALATGTTADLEVTFSSNEGDISVDVFRMVNGSITPTAIDSDTATSSSQSINVVANGVALACGITAGGPNPSSASWGGLTEATDRVYVAQLATSAFISDGVAATPLSISTTLSGGSPATFSAVSASFPPA